MVTPKLQFELLKRRIKRYAVPLSGCFLLGLLFFTGISIVFISVPCACTSKHKEATIEAGNLSSMVEQYMFKSTPPELPKTLMELEQCSNPITKKVPQDPWGNDYIYRRLGKRQFEVFSKGPDGEAHTYDDIHPEE